jgi:hypothetical protein
MNTARMTRSAIALLAVALVCACAAVVLAWGGASLQSEANLFGESINLDPSSGAQFTEDQYRYMNSLWMSSGAMLQLISPAIIAAMVAVFVALSLLATRWEGRRRERQLAERAAAAEPVVAS